MQLVLIDLVPALLTWEGRDASGPPEPRDGAVGMVDDLFTDFRMAGITDADHPATEVREALERHDLDLYFDNVGTSSTFGPRITPRVVRRVAAALGEPGTAIVVTARPHLAEALRRSGIAVVAADGPLADVPREVRRMASGRINP